MVTSAIATTVVAADSFRGNVFQGAKIRLTGIPNRSNVPSQMPFTPPLRRIRTTTTMSSSSSITMKMTTTRTEMRGELAQISNTHAMEGSPDTSRAYPNGHLGPTTPAELIMSQVISTPQDSLMTIIKATSTLLPVPTEALPRGLLTLQEPKEGQTTRIPIKVADTAQLLATAAMRPPTATIQSIITVGAVAPTGTPIVIEVSRDSHSLTHICFLDININIYSEQALSPFKCSM